MIDGLRSGFRHALTDSTPGTPDNRADKGILELSCLYRREYLPIVMSYSQTSDDHTTSYKGSWLKEALKVHPDCQTFRQLCTVIEIQRRSIASNIPANTEEQADAGDCVGQVTNEERALKLRLSLEDMNSIINFIHTHRFLDIGCCPGGYSTLVMNLFANATGMGISLPESDGGHGLAIPEALLPRLNLQLDDLTMFDLTPDWSDKPPLLTPLKPIPFDRNTFDFVICDAHYRQPQPVNDPRPWNSTRLLISQLLLALYGIHPGGRIFLTLRNVENPLTAQILVALNQISTGIHTLKSRTIHRHRPNFYALATGIQTNSSQYTSLVHSLKKLWWTMTFGGEGGQGRDVTWTEKEMIAPWDDVMSEAGLALIIRLGNPVWRIQFNALLRTLQAQGMEIDIDQL
ncbi:FtsJ-like methyltransferase [Rhizoctonia solani]|uniref:FtsJ-like methyltransferase n=1 Tax=Rhizoctonia solani TaxID=456999 RepID=A0A8H7HBI5_9AGAM|nr:FtsJ-like methyltransferase [Rhizoctonia solani]